MSLHQQPVFEYLGQPEGSFPVSEAAARRVISLPMHPYLTEEQQGSVVAALKQAVAG
jgi:UDP-2-acetamido-2-deoxy-ribo-hexuluronate aminotransferase